MKTTPFYISKETVLSLLDEWLDEEYTLKIEIMPVDLGFLVFYHEHDEHMRTSPPT